MPEDRASRDGLLYLKEEELRSVLRNVPISDVYCVEDTVFARGKFATVRRALHKTTGVQYAAKYIKKRRRNVNMVPEINHEISVLLKCGSNNRVVRLYEVYETNSDMVLILGLAAGGELQSILDGDQCLGEIEARRAMRQILDGLCFLHERNIAHLDLKPQNILLMVEDSCDDIKLCDFGISRLLEPGTEVRTLSGTPDYVAPEVVSYEPISLSTDIWSVGVLAYVLLSGYTPFGADTKEQTSLNISKGIVTFEPEDFVDVSSVALDFIKSILVLNPKQRPSVQELLQHPWINPQSHILPSLSLKTSSDTINVTPKSTPINQRKSLPCPPETLPTNNTRTTFKSDNMNENESTENGVNNEIGSLERMETNGDKDYDAPNSNGQENSSLDCQLEEATINRPCTLEYLLDTACKVESDLVSPNDVLSEVSSEEIEENFYLLKTAKFVSNEDLYPSIPSNSEFNEEKENNVEVHEEHHEKTHITTTTINGFLANQNNTYIYKSNEDLLSDSGIVGSVELEIDQSRLNEVNNDIEECADKSDTYLDESTQEHRDEISEIKINFGVPTEADDTICLCANNDVMPEHNTYASSSQKTFINTLELNKQIVFSFNYAITSESSARNSSESVLINSAEIKQTFCHDERLESIEILTNNDNETTEEAEYSNETNKIFVNTFKIENEDSRL